MSVQSTFNGEEMQMSLQDLYGGIHRDALPKSKANFEYLLIYATCFALYLVPVAVRHFARAASGERRGSVFGEVNAVAANCAAMSFGGL